MKKCKKCLVEKLLEDFYKDKTREDGLYPYCIGCTRGYQSEVYAKSKNLRDKARIRSRNRKFKRREDYRENRDYMAEKLKIWRSSPDEKRKRYCRSVLQTRIKQGTIKKENICNICRIKIKTECHHYDYSKPYQFIELCRGCHTETHRKYDKIII